MRWFWTSLPVSFTQGAGWPLAGLSWQSQGPVSCHWLCCFLCLFTCCFSQAAITMVLLLSSAHLPDVNASWLVSGWQEDVCGGVPQACVCLSLWTNISISSDYKLPTCWLHLRTDCREPELFCKQILAPASSEMERSLIWWEEPHLMAVWPAVPGFHPRTKAFLAVHLLSACTVTSSTSACILYEACGVLSPLSAPEHLRVRSSPL